MIKGDGNSRPVGSRRREDKVREVYFLVQPGIKKFRVAEHSIAKSSTGKEMGVIFLAVSHIEFSPPAHVKQTHRFVSCDAEHSIVI